MEGEMERKPRIRRENNFVVEENIDALKWPQQCAECGRPVEVTDTLKLEKTYKTLGKINVTVAGIPYCQEDMLRVRRGKLLERVRMILAFVIGIPLGFIGIALAANSPGTKIILFGVVMFIGVLAGYGLAWLIVKVPVKLLFKSKFADPVDGWLIEEKKKDGKEGVSVVLSIPNKEYADLFARTNGV